MKFKRFFIIVLLILISGCAKEPIQDGIAEEIVCEKCQYLEDNICVSYECCKDSDCFSNKCINSGAKNAYCEGNIQTEKEQGKDVDEELPRTKPKLLGSRKILIVEFTQENLQYGNEVEGYNLIDFLNNPKEYKYLKEPYGYNVYSLNSIPDWFESEAQKYNIDLNFNIDIIGPFGVDYNPPERGFYDACRILNDYFEEQLVKNNIYISDYDGISILFFQNGDQIFWSCAGDKLNYVNVDWVETLNVHTYSVIQTIVHETIHLFGARDKYTGRICNIPEGIPEPNKIPLFPQTKGCMMCGKRMSNEKHAGNVDTIKELVVCEKTAEEIGWVS